MSGEDGLGDHPALDVRGAAVLHIREEADHGVAASRVRIHAVPSPLRVSVAFHA
jgi:hypothetical protein